MSEEILKQRNFELRAVLFFLLALLLFVGNFGQRHYDAHQALKKNLHLLQRGMEQEREQNRQQLDSLQQLMETQDQANLQLKEKISQLGVQKNSLKRKSDENKAAIVRIADVDSLRREVSKHYR